MLLPQRTDGHEDGSPVPTDELCHHWKSRSLAIGSVTLLGEVMDELRGAENDDIAAEEVDMDDWAYIMQSQDMFYAERMNYLPYCFDHSAYFSQ